MSDQCKYCLAKGDYQKCNNTICSQHESWIGKKRMEIIDMLVDTLIVIEWSDPYIFNRDEVIKMVSSSLKLYEKMIKNEAQNESD